MGNPNNQDIYGLIKQIVLEETLFLRHYIGQVYSVSDTLRKGRVQVMLKELGWETPNMAIWAWPRQGNGVSLPAVNSWVEVYFINGDPNRPVYLFPVSEMQNQVPSKFDGQAGTHVLFQDPNKSENYIKFDAAQNLCDFFGKFKLDINKNTLNFSDKLKVDATAGTIDMLNATMKMVLGDALDNWFTNTLIIWLNTHTHSFVGTGTVGTPNSGAVTAPTNYLSNDAKVS